MDKFQRDIANATLKAKGKRPNWLDLDNAVIEKFNELKPSVISTMDYLKHYLPATEFLYVKINPRHWWCPHACRLTKWLDYLMIGTLSKKYGIKQIWMKEIYLDESTLGSKVMFGMLKCDLVHLNYHGNRAFVSAVMHPILHKWVCKINEYQVKNGLPRY